MRKIFFCAFVAVSSLGFSQNLCGTDEMVDRSIQLDPSKKIILENLKKFTAEYIKNNPNAEKQGATYIIPVVVHVIHNYGSENISKAQIEDAIKIMNEDFQRRNSDTNQVVSSFKNIIADIEVEFRLARKDPNGLCTEGITRTVSGLTYNADDNVKDLISWDTKKYYNIWVVDKISFGAGGYAYYPGSAPQQNYEGVVCLNSQFGGIGQSGGSNFAKRTMTHETGHWLNLAHTWGSSNSCGDSGNCWSDDGIGDTPNTLGNCQTCILTSVTCGSLDNVQNYMDYSVCTNMFTNGQKANMQAALNSGAGFRNMLWTSSNLLSTGTNNGYVANCQPIADFNPQKKIICAGDSVLLLDLSYNATIDSTWTWSWSFPGGSPSTSSLQNPKVVYFTPGKYNVTLVVSNSNGTDSYTRNQVIEVLSNSLGIVAPTTEGFESPSFPYTNNVNTDWYIQANGSTDWQRNTAAAYSGNASIRILPSMLIDNETQEFISPTIDFTTPNLLEMTFMLSWAQSNSSSLDELRVYVSTNCGKTWLIRYSKSAANLSTTGILVNPPYIPSNANQWRKETVNLSPFSGSQNLKLKFQLIPKGGLGNYLYIDDINIGGKPLSVNQSGFFRPSIKIFPNPSKSGKFELQYQLEKDETVSYKIYNILGELVYALTEKEKSGELNKLFTINLSKGNYTLNVSGNNLNINAKLIIID